MDSIEKYDEKEENENNEIIAYTLSIYDILENIISYLNVKSLRQAAAVCRLWRETAQTELATRNEIQCLLLPLYIASYRCALNCEGDEDQSDPSDKRLEYDLDTGWDIIDVVRSIPKVFLLFHEAQTTVNVPYHYKYTKMLPESATFATFGLMMLSMDSTEIFGLSNLATGISIPSTNSLNNEVFMVDDFSLTESTAEKLVDDAMAALKISSTDKGHSCFLIFQNRENDGTLDYLQERNKAYISELLRSLKKRCEPGSYSILGSGCLCMDVFTPVSSENDLNFSFVLRLYGPAVKSWSVVLSLYLPDSIVEEQLRAFKKGVNANFHTIAIAAFPVDKRQAFECTRQNRLNADIYLHRTDVFKKVFPNVPLICLYDDQTFTQIGCNTLNDVHDSSMEHKDSVIYLVMSTT
ncbi:uncharacterized protein LOC131674711 [Phymastichus coffea]|uniref:uncharacterized protein LOC131674711 n=1 Tax=Phymastichus coffea TaxID=108790 RepID=UPI00273A8BA2|nr:uncharacterized protein LOC131674711 [Phymastichus coffea]